MGKEFKASADALCESIRAFAQAVNALEERAEQRRERLEKLSDSISETGTDTSPTPAEQVSPALVAADMRVEKLEEKVRDLKARLSNADRMTDRKRLDELKAAYARIAELEAGIDTAPGFSLIR